MNKKITPGEPSPKTPRGLGKGLDALIPQTNANHPGLTTLPLHQIKPNENQPRRDFDPETLEELAVSLRQVGMLQPILVKKVGQFYQIIAGERRWRAAHLANLTHIPVLIKDFDDKEMIQVALLENIQRENLNAIEEALAFQQLVSEFGLTHEALSLELGKSRSSISNTLRLLQLDESIQQLLVDKKIHMGHGKLLLSLDKPAQQHMVELIITNNLSVRDTEQAIKKLVTQGDNKAETTEATSAPHIFIEYPHLENDLEMKLGSKVKIIQKKGTEKGRIEINFTDADDLDRLFLVLRQEN